jgi:hypothetical protein
MPYVRATAAALCLTALVAVPARAATSDPSRCPVRVSELSVLGTPATQDSLSDVCDALRGANTLPPH